MELTEAQINCLLRAGENEVNKLIDGVEDFRKLCKDSSVINPERAIIFANEALDLEALSIVLNGLADGLTCLSKKKDFKKVCLTNIQAAQKALSAFDIEALDDRDKTVGVLTLFPEGIQLDTTKQEVSVIECEINDFLD